MATQCLYDGHDEDTMEEIEVEYVHQKIQAVCAECGVERMRRTLRRDFAICESFITWPWTDDYEPSYLYRHCPDCDRETTNLTRTVG
jgi:hypothetical protein